MKLRQENNVAEPLIKLMKKDKDFAIRERKL